MTECWFKNIDAQWEVAELLAWSTDSEWDDKGVYLHPVAVVKCVGGRVRNIYATEIRLEPPEEPKLVKAAGWYKRFEPRLIHFPETMQWGVQVHPEVFEMFNVAGQHLCQVQWIRGRIVYPQGGLPIKKLTVLFEETNEQACPGRDKCGGHGECGYPENLPCGL